MREFLLNTVTQIAPHASTTPPPELKSPSLFKLGLSFVALLLVLAFLVWILRKISGSRMGFFHSDGKVKVIERKALSQKTNLYIIEISGQRYLISESALHVKMESIAQTTE